MRLHHSLITSLHSGTVICFRLILYFDYPGPGINHFSNMPCSLLWRMEFRNQDLRVRYVLCYWDAIASRPSQWTQLDYIHTHTGNKYTYIHNMHSYVYVYIYMHVSTSTNAHTFMSVCGFIHICAHLTMS